MNFVGTIACLALCLERAVDAALGIPHSTFLWGGAVWLQWAFAFMWLCYGIKFIARMMPK